MPMSNLLEFGGKANVILRAVCDFEVNNNSYKKGDIVFCFEEVDVAFNYNETIKDSSVAGRNLLVYDERKLNSMTIDSTPLTTNFIELFATKTQDNFERPVIEELAIADGKFYPNEMPSNDNIYIIGLGQYKFQSTVIDPVNNLVECELIISEEEVVLMGTYQCVYDTLIDRPKYDINNNYTLPYFRAQIVGIGNVDKQTSYAYFDIPRVSLLTRPDYSMNRVITAQSLIFKIVCDKLDSRIEVGVY